METLLDFWDGKIEYKGKKYRVNVAYDTVLIVQKLYADERLEAGDKITQALKLMVKSRFKLWLLTDVEKVELFEKISNEMLTLPSRPQIGPPRKLMDFEADSDYIYASFRQAYDIDLLQERGRLPWRRFCELLDGLPEKTKLKEVMKIRAMEIPEPTKYNQKERKNIIDLKAYYAIPAKERSGQDGLNMLFATLERMAK